jgi:hypothetical protein
MMMRNMEGTGIGLSSSDRIASSPLIVIGYEDDANANQGRNVLFGAGDESIDRMETQASKNRHRNHTTTQDDSEESGLEGDGNGEDENTAAKMRNFLKQNSVRLEAYLRKKPLPRVP